MRSKTTNQFDIKMTYQAATSDNLSVRYSRQSSDSSDPGTFGENGIWGGIKDYAGTGGQPSYNMLRELQPGVVLDADPGNPHRPELLPQHRDYGCQRDEPGRRDRHTGREPDHVYQRGSPINIPAYHAFLLGTQNSLPWDRAKRTTNLATNVTKIWGNHTLKVGGEFRNTNDFLDQVPTRAANSPSPAR